MIIPHFFPPSKSLLALHKVCPHRLCEVSNIESRKLSYGEISGSSGMKNCVIEFMQSIRTSQVTGLKG